MDYTDTVQPLLAWALFNATVLRTTVDFIAWGRTVRKNGVRGKKSGFRVDVGITDVSKSGLASKILRVAKNATYAQALMQNCGNIVLESENLKK
jgi:hypothetical protein